MFVHASTTTRRFFFFGYSYCRLPPPWTPPPKSSWGRNLLTSKQARTFLQDPHHLTSEYFLGCVIVTPPFHLRRYLCENVQTNWTRLDRFHTTARLLRLSPLPIARSRGRHHATSPPPPLLSPQNVKQESTRATKSHPGLEGRS